jgi:hypothetical protein
MMKAADFIIHYSLLNIRYSHCRRAAGAPPVATIRRPVGAKHGPALLMENAASPPDRQKHRELTLQRNL